MCQRVKDIASVYIRPNSNHYIVDMRIFTYSVMFVLQALNCRCAALCCVACSDSSQSPKSEITVKIGRECSCDSELAGWMDGWMCLPGWKAWRVWIKKSICENRSLTPKVINARKTTDIQSKYQTLNYKKLLFIKNSAVNKKTNVVLGIIK